MKTKSLSIGAMLSSDKMDWATPQAFYDALDEEFCFTVDVCAEAWNAKHERFWTVQDDALSLSWDGEVCFMNPPYGREIGKWVAKAHQEAERGATVVALIPARTDTAYWHDHIQGKAEVRFVRGRIKFERPDGVRDPAPFPSAVIVWRSSK